MADQDDHVYVFDWTGAVLKDFAFAFGEEDGLAVGDVNGDTMDEVVLRTETAAAATISPPRWPATSRQASNSAKPLPLR